MNRYVVLFATATVLCYECTLTARVPSDLPPYSEPGELMQTMKNRHFHVELDPILGAVTHVKRPDDPNGMNWLMHTDEIPGHLHACTWGLGTYNTGVPFAPVRWQRADGFKASATVSVSTYQTVNAVLTVQRRFVGDRLRETYTFTNPSKQETTLVLLRFYWPFNDNYTPDAATCVKKRCTVHYWFGGDVSWAHAVRMDGTGLRLGLVVKQGRFESYGVENRGFLLGYSNFRGDITPYAGDIKLPPGGKAVFEWEFFWCADWNDFFAKLQATPGYIGVSAPELCTVPGQKLEVAIRSKTKPEVKRGEQALAVRRTGDGWKCSVTAVEPGLVNVNVKAGERSTLLTGLALPDPDALIRKRADFIIEKQQMMDKKNPLYGAFLIYDVEARSTVIGYRDDFNEARERLGMGVLLALEQARVPRPTVARALKRYEAFVRTKLQREDGAVLDAAGGAPRRGYNYAWVAQFYIALYRMNGRREYIDLAVKTVEAFYRDHGAAYMAIGVPVLDGLDIMRKLGLDKQRAEFLGRLEAQADRLIKNGLHFPPQEVTFEQSIVSPAVTFLLEMYLGTGEKKYLKAARAPMTCLEHFNGCQPDARLNDVSIRHWDGYWFGKRESWGDTMPHHWSALTALSFHRWFEATGDTEYRDRAQRILKANMYLFRSDGSGSAAHMYPKWVNGSWTTGLDPYANDQDWALVHYRMLQLERLR
jgi:hypothetical protein